LQFARPGQTQPGGQQRVGIKTEVGDMWGTIEQIPQKGHALATKMSRTTELASQGRNIKPKTSRNVPMPGRGPPTCPGNNQLFPNPAMDSPQKSDAIVSASPNFLLFAQ